MNGLSIGPLPLKEVFFVHQLTNYQYVSTALTTISVATNKKEYY
jgi:hypothetical protein